MLKIVRNDLVKMHCDAIVNTANAAPIYSHGVDSAVYEAAGVKELLAERQKIGCVPEGEVFVTDAYHIPVKKIIHAVSPFYIDGNSGEEERLRRCYRKSLDLAKALNLHSIAFPVIATGSFCYPLEEGMHIAVEEINSFLKHNDMLVYLVVFDAKATDISRNFCNDLESFIDQNYVDAKHKAEYLRSIRSDEDYDFSERFITTDAPRYSSFAPNLSEAGSKAFFKAAEAFNAPEGIAEENCYSVELHEDSFYELEDKLNDRLKHTKDTFSEYLMYFIESRGMTSHEVYTRALVSKKVFSKLKNNVNYHPSKEIALQLCMGAKLNIDETKDLLSRAGYAFSPCDLMDIIFEFFIENEYYDMIELDIQLEEHGLPCIIKVD